MGNSSAILHPVPRKTFLPFIVLKFIAMIIGVLILLRNKKTATSYLVGNLALADLLVCLTFYPKWIIEFIQTILYIDSDQDLFCKFGRSTIWALLFASVATLLSITVLIDIYLYKTSQVSTDCDGSGTTSISSYFGNLAKYELGFHWITDN
jgi:hypothetical protein